MHNEYWTCCFFLWAAFVCFKNEANKPKILERVVCLFVCCEWSWYMLRDDDEIIRTIFQFFIIFTFLLHRKPHAHCFNLLFCSEQAFFFRRMRCPWSMRFIVYICSIYSRISEFLRQYRTKKWLFQHVTYVVKRPKYIRYVHNIGLFVRLHSVCFNFFFILIAFSYSGRFFSFARAETSLSLQVISCILDLGMVVWGPSLRQTHIKGWNASLFLFVCNF